MEELTSYQLISTSLETLRQAAVIVQREEDRLLSFGIKKAVDILEILVTESGENTYENPDETAQNITYTPEVLSLEALLNPIAQDKPGGDNIRLTGEVSELLSLVVNRSRAADFKPQYRSLREKAEELLITRGKDLGVAVRLIEAAITDEEKSGFAAVADGLLLINGFISTFWEGFYPECIEGDCEARGNELQQLEELVIRRLSARYGKPHEFLPEFTDIKAAGREAAIFRIIFEQLDLLDRSTYTKFKNQAPSLGEIRNVLGTYRQQVDLQFDVFKQQIKEKCDEVAMQREQKLNAAIEKISEENDKQKSTEKGDASLSGNNEPRDMAHASQLISSCARFFIHTVPDDPIGYMIHRGQRWFSRSFDGPKDIPSPQMRQTIADMLSAQKWNDLLQSCEELFMNGAHDWLDLQRYQVLAAEQLGLEYKTIAKYIINAIVYYVTGNNALLEKKIDNHTPAVSAETAQWINNEIGVGSNKGYTERLHTQTATSFANETRKADELAEKGRAGAALNLLFSCQNSARSRRERFLWQLSIAELCVRTNMTKIALPGIEYMIETIDRLNLTEWEDPDILKRVYKIGYDGYISLGIDNAPEGKIEYFYQRICLYDPVHFISDSSE